MMHNGKCTSIEFIKSTRFKKITIIIITGIPTEWYLF